MVVKVCGCSESGGAGAGWCWVVLSGGKAGTWQPLLKGWYASEPGLAGDCFYCSILSFCLISLLGH